MRYTVDDGQKNEMTIRLPASYPLADVEVVGTSRVGVHQERWNKWLLTCQVACRVSLRLKYLIFAIEWDDCGCAQFIRE
jgi:hypothetical protein